MNIIIDIGHPAHVHVFRNYYEEMTLRGHGVHFTCRDKECTIQLLEHYRLPFTLIGKPFKGSIMKLLGLFVFGWRIRQVAKKHKADLFISVSSMYAAQCAWLMRKHHIVLDDTEHSGFEHMLYRPFSSIILTPSCFEKHMGRKQVRYDGFHELAYLHPRRLDLDHNIRLKMGIPTEGKFAVLRFVSWNAAHDRSANGLDLATKTDLVNRLQKHCHVLISAEGELPPELETRRIRIAPQDMHSVLSQASLYVGEGATMASECAMLGTPAIYINSLNAGTLREQESYGLIHSFRTGKGVAEEAELIISQPHVRDSYSERSAVMVREKVDVTSMLVDISMGYGQEETNFVPVRYTKLKAAG